MACPGKFVRRLVSFHVIHHVLFFRFLSGGFGVVLEYVWTIQEIVSYTFNNYSLSPNHSILLETGAAESSGQQSLPVWVTGWFTNLVNYPGMCGLREALPEFHKSIPLVFVTRGLSILYSASDRNRGVGILHCSASDTDTAQIFIAGGNMPGHDCVCLSLCNQAHVAHAIIVRSKTAPTQNRKNTSVCFATGKRGRIDRTKMMVIFVRRKRPEKANFSQCTIKPPNRSLDSDLPRG